MNAEGYNNFKIDGAKNWVIERSISHFLADTRDGEHRTGRDGEGGINEIIDVTRQK